ncbi:glycoside hydrolase family 78 protein [Ruminococcaceae bacterium OttesenSCG-928-L11]|nr:glycoside hydrolase family 78 protein [Ruminococcaceae bacterium OttesenSCG-928-L11]
MTITRMKANHLVNPMGYRLEPVTLSWVVEDTTGKRQDKARVEIATVPDFSRTVFDSGESAAISSIGYCPAFTPEPRTRYYWRVQVWADNGDTAVSAPAWFETGLMGQDWQAAWIQSPFDKDTHPLFHKEFPIGGKIAEARVYICGLGLYELEINGRVIGDDILAPFYNDYDTWLQYQTYDITDALQTGDNAVGVMLGNGWYKGRFGFGDGSREIYGDTFRLLCTLRITLEDGSELCIGTDNSWLCHPSPVELSDIYDGEIWDARKALSGWSLPGLSPAGFVPAVEGDAPAGKLTERLSPPVAVIETLPVKEVIHTPAGETVLDFGQELTGWVELDCHLPEGQSIRLQHGEILQQGNFYTENLRSAKQAYTYISDGKAAHVRPHFTFYGFRYVKVESPESVDPSAFVACVIHSQLEATGRLETSNPKVNRLVENARWGQKGNFLDVPTDCPQRDERMGWTGDAQIFAATASFFMETPAFYDKYLQDMWMEQQKHGGAVPHVIPDVISRIGEKQARENKAEEHIFGAPWGSCAWGDAAAVIPWTLYRFYGDTAMLSRHYPAMKAWVDFIKTVDDTECGGSRLWKHGFHFADWLALDNPDPDSPMGGTDPYFIASAYYCLSSTYTAKAAQALGKTEDAAFYGKLAEEVRAAIQREYFTGDGLAIDTQTALVVALHFDLAPEQLRPRLAQALKAKLEASDVHLTTGFVGTPYLCPALCENGLEDLAYTLLLNEDYPSWLYEVNMGATTIWERWNSVLEDGSISSTGMNSLNHYAYGSIAEWMFRYMCGLNPDDSAPGFQKAILRPCFDDRFDYATAEYDSVSGTYRCGWKRVDGCIELSVDIPFNCTAELMLTQPCRAVEVDGETRETSPLFLDAGRHTVRIR